MLLIPFVSAEEAGQVLVEAKVYKVDKLHRAISLKELLAGAAPWTSTQRSSMDIHPKLHGHPLKPKAPWTPTQTQVSKTEKGVFILRENRVARIYLFLV